MNPENRSLIRQERESRRGWMTLFLLAIFLCLAAGMHPLAARQKEGVMRGGDTPVAKREGHPPVSAPDRPSVRQGKSKKEGARKETDRKERPARVNRSEKDRRPENRPKSELPIIEGRKTDRSMKALPERPQPETRDRLRGSPSNMPGETNERVRSTLDRFRQDWISGDSRSLTHLLSNRSRVKITIESKDIDDTFGRGQAQYILREYFSSTEKRELSFSRFRVSATDGITAYGVGKMKIRDRKTGKIMDHTVYVSMAREGGDWAVREIRVTD
jgi:hypothetical protein